MQAGSRQAAETPGKETRIMAVIDDLACWYEMLFLVSFNHSPWIKTVYVPLRSLKKMMTSSRVLCRRAARAAQKRCERCAAYPLHQSTQFKGQRSLMNIWWKWSSSAGNCCFDFFVPPILETSPNRRVLTFFLACSQERSQERRGQNKKKKGTNWHLD